MVAPYDHSRLAATRSLSGRRADTDRAGAQGTGRRNLAMRKYRISALLEDGSVRSSDQIGPAMPVFEIAFSAFAHGTLIDTSIGPVAVEDLEPGMKIVTADQGAVPLIWLGSMTLMPPSDRVPHGGGLTRIMADSFGMGRPHTDLMAGPGARLLMRPSGLAGRSGNARTLTPAARIADGMNAIAITPPRPVTVHHLCLRRHAIVSAAGMEVESFHPGPGFERNMGPNMLSLFLSFFPHVKAARDFGPLAHERLPFEHESMTGELA